MLVYCLQAGGTTRAFRYSTATDVYSFALSVATILLRSISTLTVQSLRIAGSKYHAGLAGSSARSSQVEALAARIVWLPAWGVDGDVRSTLAIMILKGLASNAAARIGISDIVSDLQLICMGRANPL